MIEGHGDDSYKYQRPITTNFSSNVYSRVDLSALKAHLCRCINGDGASDLPTSALSASASSVSCSLSSYPEPEPYTLESRLARRHGLPTEAVCVTNGATEAIYLTAQTFRGTNSAILQPTFSEYADACRMHGHRVTSLYQLPSVHEGGLLPEEVRMLWLCNPNNPTGAVVDKDYLTELIERNPQVCFVIDQSYEYFTLRPLFSAAEAAAFPNVLLLHSMTKRYAVPACVWATSPVRRICCTACVPTACPGRSISLPLRRGSICWNIMFPVRWMWRLTCKRLPACASRSKRWEDWRYGPPKPISCWYAFALARLLP